MSSFRLLFFAVGYVILTGCTQKPISNSRPDQVALPAIARISGDHPDPSIILVNHTYWAVATTSAWAPAFTILSSPDLSHWEVTSAVFPVPPAWSDGNYWAPEIAHFDGQYFVYYAAKNKKTQSMCVAVAIANSPAGPYHDHGPMVCEAVGSIDPAPVVDENGRKFLFWKEDGNSQKKPTPIHVQELSPDGTKLIGIRADTITNDTPWEKSLVEAPAVFKHGAYWYMLYAGNDCCGRACNYAVGVARARTLQGSWEKNPANPILASNSLWKCPGHGTVVSGENSSEVFVYHAYHATDFNDVGRQVLADTLDWNSATEWPTINNGLGGGLNLSGLLKPVPPNESVLGSDDFSSSVLKPDWQWPSDARPVFALTASSHQITIAPKRGLSTVKQALPTAAILARTVTHGNYVVTTAVKPSQALAGLAAVGNAKNAFGLSVRRSSLTLWKVQDGIRTDLVQTPLMKMNGSEFVHLKMKARQGHYFQFSASADGQEWQTIGSELDGSYLPPWDLGIRASLTASGGAGTFTEFKMEATPQ